MISIVFSILVYDNEYKTVENENWTKDKIKLQHIQHRTIKLYLTWTNKLSYELTSLQDVISSN